MTLSSKTLEVYIPILLKKDEMNYHILLFSIINYIIQYIIIIMGIYKNSEKNILFVFDIKEKHVCFQNILNIFYPFFNIYYTMTKLQVVEVVIEISCY